MAKKPHRPDCPCTPCQEWYRRRITALTAERDAALAREAALREALTRLVRWGENRCPDCGEDINDVIEGAEAALLTGTPPQGPQDGAQGVVT